MTTEYVECDVCYLEVPESKIEIVMVYGGCREEPPEYENVCSECIANSEPNYENMVEDEFSYYGSGPS